MIFLIFNVWFKSWFLLLDLNHDLNHGFKSIDLNQSTLIAVEQEVIVATILIASFIFTHLLMYTNTRLVEAE